MSKLSIITVNYNNCQGLERTINSIAKQSYRDIEYIVIDGGSIDDSVEIIKKNESVISLWVSEKDNGIYNAMNKGIKYATGEWIIMMNAGDIFNNESVLQNIMNNNEIMKNPIAKNIIDMAQKGDVEGIEQMGRNIAKEKGIDFDKAFSDFKKQFPIEK